MVTMRHLQRFAAEPAVHGDPGHGAHHAQQGTLTGRLEFGSNRERVERKSRRLHPFTNSPMAQKMHIGSARTQRARDAQLRWEVPAAVDNDKQDLHVQLLPTDSRDTERTASLRSSIRSRTSSTVRPRSRRSSFQQYTSVTTTSASMIRARSDGSTDNPAPK